MRIVHIITRLIRGGADENTVLSCNGQAELGHDVHLIYGAEASPAMVNRLHPAVRGHQVAALLRPVEPLSDARATLRIAAMLRQIGPDIVHTHTSKAGIIGRIAARVARIPGVVHGIHILPFLNVGRAEQLVYLTAERLLAHVTDAFVDVSDGMMESAVRHGVGPAPKHTVVPSGMDVTRFRAAPPVATRDVADAFACTDSEAESVKVLVMVAALERRKRVAEFLDVFAQVLRREPAAALVVLGEGPERGAIAARAAALGVGHRVALPGFVNDVERWIARADVCVLASEREGLPRAVIQYVLAGRPAVATVLPGLEALVKHGSSGYLVPTERIEEMADPICRLLTDRNLAHSMASEARALDLSRWSTRHMIDALEGVYQSVLERQRLPVRA